MRSLVFSTRLRFSPQIHPVRETAIDKIVEQNLLLDEGGLTINGILDESLALKQGPPVLTAHDVKDSIERLLVRGRVAAVPVNGGSDRYTLSDIARIELWQSQHEAENRFTRVCDRLFKHVRRDRDQQTKAFLSCLCIIFSRLGEAYVRVLKGDNRISDFVGPNTIEEAVKESSGSRDNTFQKDIQSALLRFFEENDPDFAAVKWNLAQNYYVAKAIGLDPSGALLSREVFAGAVFYLDTNVVIPALEPKAPDHASARMLMKAKKQIGFEVRACQISLEQMRNVALHHAMILPKVIGQIPDEIAPKVRNVFYALYLGQVSETGEFDANTVFDKFYRPTAYFPDAGIDLCDDAWFLNIEENAEIRKSAAALNASLVARRRRPKRDRSALHDAALVRWIDKERSCGKENCWLVTLDSSLSDTSWASVGAPIAITLDALLQWLSPLATSENGDFETSYSEAVKNLLLPQENFFDLRDFLIFAEIEWSCKELPAKDVEDCIRSIKIELPGVDPTTPEGRETLAHHIGKFFADPGRQFKAEVQRLEREKHDEAEAFEQLLIETEAAKNSEVAERDQTIINLQRQLEAEKRRRQDEATEFAAKLQNERIERDKALLKRSGKYRLSLCFLLMICAEGVAAYLLVRWGDGTNALKKIIDGWPILSALLLVAFFASWFLLGKKRLRALGWPFTKLLKSEEVEQPSSGDPGGTGSH
jgi:hypothetical protein